MALYNLTPGNDLHNDNAGANEINGLAGNDTINGDGGDDTIDGGIDNDSLSGGLGNDIIYGGTGLDFIDGGENNDTIYAGDDNDTIFGGLASDRIYGENGADIIYGGAGSDAIYAGAGNDSLYGGNNDTLASGTDYVRGEGGNDTYYHNGNGRLTIIEGTDTANSDSIRLTQSSFANVFIVEPDLFNTWHLTIRQHGDTIGANDVVISNYFGGGQNTVEYLYDKDGLYIKLTDVYGSYYSDTMLGSTGDDIKYGFDGNDSLTGSGGADFLAGGAGADTLDGGADTDTASYQKDQTGITVDLTLATAQSGGEAQGDILTGIENVTGGAGNDSITGNSSANYLDGFTGSDTLAGGAGNDIYVVDSISDVVTENSGEGLDRVESYVSYTLGANVEYLTLLETANINGTGNAGDNELSGNAGSNVLSGGDGNDVFLGGGGNDTMNGGLGDDIFSINSLVETIVENSGEGTDRVLANIDYTLGANVENLTLNGTVVNGNGNALNNSILGNASANNLDGASGNDTLDGGNSDDTLDGGSGVDSMVGGAGNDTYYVDNTSDVVTEAAASGNDVVNSSASYTLSANVETLILTGVGNVNGTGNALANTITGNSGNNSLAGLDGNDSLTGGSGVDALTGGTGTDSFIYAASASGVGAGNRDIISDFSQSDGDKINLSAVTAGLSFVYGGAFTGAKQVRYEYDSGNTIVQIDSNGDGTADMEIQLTGTFSLTETDFVGVTPANVTMVGSAAADTIVTGGGADSIDGAGGNDTINSGNGNDTIIGGAGVDSMIGGAGNDVYYVDDSADIIVEASGQGTDVVNSTVDYVLSADIENLTLTGSTNINGTGNAVVNTITGNSGNNSLFGDGANDSLVGGAGHDTLDGGTGNDTMRGGLGDDTYHMDSASDLISENASEGTDTVVTSIAYTLGGNLENLTFTGASNINSTGNSFANVITGNANNNRLYGLSGADTLIGGDGDDTLDGGQLIDSMVGGLGNDTYYLVSTTLTYTLGANIEKLTLTGSGIINGTGNALNNFITGNGNLNSLSGGNGDDTIDGGIGADTIDGGSGADSMVGGTGNDVFYVDDAGDVVTELNAGGTDTVNTSLSYTLATYIEHLNLTGTGNVNGYGNSGNNNITGNSGDNFLFGDTNGDYLTGGDGSDTLDGGAGIDNLNGGNGVDYLTGGTDLDRFIYAAALESGIGAGNRDVIADFLAGTDDINLSSFAGTFGFRGTSAFTGTANQVRYYQTGTDTIVEIDTNADGVANMEIELSGLMTLAAGDFIL